MANPAFALPSFSGPAVGSSPQDALNLTSGAPLYQRAILSQTMKNLQPAYTSALAKNSQDLANRGMNNSGLSAFDNASTTNDYTNQIGQAATTAATKGADVGLENQRIKNQYAQQTALQAQEIAGQQELQQNQFNQQQNMAGQSALLGAGEKVGGSLLGAYLGGPVGASLLGGAVGGGAPNAATSYANNAGANGTPNAAEQAAIQNGTAEPLTNAPGYGGTAPSASAGPGAASAYLRALSSAGYSPNALQQLGALGPYGGMLGMQGLY